MIELQEILDVALCFAGRTLTEGEESVLSSLCEGAYRLWESRLRDEVEPEDCRGIFIAACAWTALGSLSGVLEAGSPAPLSFSAGDFSVSTSRSTDASACAKSLQAQAEVLMAPYTTDGEFAFLEVAG